MVLSYLSKSHYYIPVGPGSKGGSAKKEQWQNKDVGISWRIIGLRMKANVVRTRSEIKLLKDTICQVLSNLIKCNKVSKGYFNGRLNKRNPLNIQMEKKPYNIITSLFSENFITFEELQH